MEHETAFGPWLHQKRRALDLTQEALAQKISCSAATIRKLEAELRRPSTAIIARLADFLDIHEDERAAFLRFARSGWSAHAPAVPVPGEPRPWQTPAARGNLPADPTEILGREQELEDARRFIEQGNSRLLTLTGTGGTGKTRLALEVAAGLVGHFTDGVFFVSLARIRDPALVPAAIAQTLGVRQTDEQMLAASLQAFLRERHLLLLLDNFEHVIAAAPVVSELLAARDPGTAAAHFTEGLIQHGEIGELYGIATQFAGLAAVAAMQGQAERAAQLFGAAARLFEQFGTHLDIADRESYDRGLAAARAGLSESRFQEGWCAGRNTPLPDAIRYALDRDRNTASP